MNYDFLIFGATGMQGKIVVRDLVENNYRVFISDLHQEDLDELSKKYRKIKNLALDLNNILETDKLISEIKPKVVINCAEGDWNLNVYKACLKAEVHVIDLGSEIPMTREQLTMDKLFKEKGLTAITGCGSTPGVNNIMLNHAVGCFDSIETVEAGFVWDSNIRKFVVPFSMESIIEEFTDPAPIIENGKWIKKSPLKTIEERKFRKIEKQKCFFVRHPETYTFYLYYKNKGLKNVRFYAGFPDHSFDAIRSYINGGITEREEIKIDGQGNVPLNSLTKVLLEVNPSPLGYKEKENLWVAIDGKKDEKEKKTLMECIVPTLPGWEEAGCNIDTAFPASIIGQMILKGVIQERGSFAPGPVVPAKEFFEELRKKEMKVYMNARLIN